MQQIKIKEEGFKKKLVIGNTILCLCFVLAMNVFAKVHLQQVMLSSSKKGDLVLDPFIGSGTTAVVAKALGRNWIGIEKESKYVE